MKCVISFLLFTVCATQMISAIPVQRNGMVFYQSPDFYNAHRAFVMQYASQPIKAYRRNGQAAGVTAFASGKKIATGTYLKRKFRNSLANFIPKCLRFTEAELVDEDEEEQPPSEQLDGAVQSIAEAYPAPTDDDEQNEEEEESTSVAIRPVASDEPQVPELADAPEDAPETPVRVVPNKNKKTQVQHNEDEDDEEEDSDVPVRSRNRGSSGPSYFPVTFGSTNGGAIAIANSYSTGKGKINVPLMFS